MGIHILNPPEPRCNPVRRPASNSGVVTSWKCGSCRCVPSAWKLTVPPAGRLLPERVGDFLLTRSDPQLANQCSWESAEENTLFSGGPLWRLRWGALANNVLINGDWWIIESGEPGPFGPDFQFVHNGEGDANNDYTFRSLSQNTLDFTLKDGESEDPGDPVSVSIAPFWK